MSTISYFCWLILPTAATPSSATSKGQPRSCRNRVLSLRQMSSSSTRRTRGGMDQIGFDPSLLSSEEVGGKACERSLDDRSPDIFLVTDRRIAAFPGESLVRFEEKSCFFVVNCPSVNTGAPRLGSGQTNGCENGVEVTMDEVPLKKSDVAPFTPKDAGDEETDDEEIGSMGMDDVRSGGE